MKRKKKYKVYLAGTMEYSKDNGVGWRQQMKRWIDPDVEIVDPAINETEFLQKKFNITVKELRAMNRRSARYTEIAQAIRKRDLEMIAGCEQQSVFQCLCAIILNF